jgi:hypothetical protein
MYDMYDNIPSEASTAIRLDVTVLLTLSSSVFNWLTNVDVADSVVDNPATYSRQQQ